MNTINITNLTYNGSYNNSGSSYTTASISPAANKVLLLIVASYMEPSGTPAVPTVSGGGVSSWTQLATVQGQGNSYQQRLTFFVAATGNTPGSGAITIDFSGVSQYACCWSVEQLSNVILGANGSLIAKQIGTVNNGMSDGSGNYSMGLSAFSGAKNATLGAYCDIRAADFPASAPGANFAQLSQTYSTLAVEWANNPQTTINWTALAQNVHVISIAIEIKLFLPAAAGILPFL